MPEFGAVFTTDQIFMDMIAKDDLSLLDAISERMQAQGLVTEGFGEAVKDRERVYPTGLPTQGLGVAMPHTDAEHVLVESFSLALLSQPVPFKEMGNAGQSVLVHLVFTLAIKDHHMQLAMLQGIVSMIQKPDFLQKLYQEKDPHLIHRWILEEMATITED